MKNRIPLGAAFAGVLVVLAIAPSEAEAIVPPQILQAEPARLYALGSSNVAPGSGSHVLVVNGNNMAAPNTTGYTASADIHAFMRLGNGPFQEAMVGGWSPSSTNISFFSSQWMVNPGTLGVKVVVRGVESNVFNIPILPAPTAKPTISTSLPAAIQVGTVDNGFTWLLKVYGTNIGYDAVVKVGGTDSGKTQVDLAGEFVQTWVSQEFHTKPGHYTVQIWSSTGYSNFGWLDVTEPMHIVLKAPTPPPATARAAPPPPAIPPPATKTDPKLAK